MRIDRLHIKSFKNLTDICVDFDESELSTVIIGENGTGKSNVIEALATIFRDLDLGQNSEFDYKVEYKCNHYRVQIECERRSLSYTVDGQNISKTDFMARRNKLLPAHVFAYYSGGSRRLEDVFRTHQSRYYRHVISVDSEYDDRAGADLRRLFYCRASYGQLALLSYFAFGQDSAKSFLKQWLTVQYGPRAVTKPGWSVLCP